MFCNIAICCLKVVFNQLLWKMTQAIMKSHHIRKIIHGRQLQSMLLWITDCCGNTCTRSQYNHMTTSRQDCFLDIHIICLFRFLKIRICSILTPHNAYYHDKDSSIFSITAPFSEIKRDRRCSHYQLSNVYLWFRPATTSKFLIHNS